ncbi:MAG: hypothetical protein J0H64_02205, partial [Actinobacteria bacterium]|nr:hypothetical protein [Actinomycetota bacterium]
MEQAAPEQRPTLYISKAQLLMHMLRAHEALALLAQVREMLAQHPAGEAIVAIAEAMPLSYLQREEEALRASELAVAHSEGPRPAYPRRRALLVRAGILLENDRYAEARAAVVESLHDAIRDDDQFTARMDEFTMGRVFWAMGRGSTASRWLHDTVTGAELRGPASL